MSHLPEHPILALLPSPYDRLKWLIGAVVIQAAEVDLGISLALAQLADVASDSDEVYHRLRRSWGHSGARLAAGLEEAADLWPEAHDLAAEYRELYKRRNAVTHGLHRISPRVDTSDSGEVTVELGLQQILLPRSPRKGFTATGFDSRHLNEASLYLLYCDLEAFSTKVLDAQP